MKAVFAILAFAVGSFAGYRVFAGPDLGPAPTPERVASAFAPIPGYAWQAAPAEMRAELDRQLEEDDEFGPLVDNWDIQLLNFGGRPSVVALVISVDPDEIEGDSIDDLMGGIGAAGQQTTKIQIASHDVAEGAFMGASAMFFFTEDGLIYAVFGQHRNLVEKVTSSMLEATTTI